MKRDILNNILGVIDFDNLPKMSASRVQLLFKSLILLDNMPIFLLHANRKIL